MAHTQEMNGQTIHFSETRAFELGMFDCFELIAYTVPFVPVDRFTIFTHRINRDLTAWCCDTLSNDLKAMRKEFAAHANKMEGR